MAEEFIERRDRTALLREHRRKRMAENVRLDLDAQSRLVGDTLGDFLCSTDADRK
jgi:hypothetical protein